MQRPYGLFPMKAPVLGAAYGIQSVLSSLTFRSLPCAALVVIHKSVQDRHLGMNVYLDVGRNKNARRQPGWAFPAIGAPETPVLRLTRGMAYSGLRRDVYNDERAAWEYR
jgi:hypothetical protein